jgi:hypothetical protein
MAQTTLITGNRFFPKFGDGQLWAGTYNRSAAWVPRTVTINDSDPSAAGDGFEFWGTGLRVKLHNFTSGMLPGDINVWGYAGTVQSWNKITYYDSGLTLRTYGFVDVTHLDLIIPQEHIVGTERVFIQLTNTDSPGTAVVEYMIL